MSSHNMTANDHSSSSHIHSSHHHHHHGGHHGHSHSSTPPHSANSSNNSSSALASSGHSHSVSPVRSSPDSTTINIAPSELELVKKSSNNMVGDGDSEMMNEEQEREELLQQRRLEEGRKEREEANKREAKKVMFLCLDLSHLSQSWLFLLLSGGVLGFFLLNSWLEEYLFKSLKDFKFGWYMTAFELMCFAGFAIIERWARRLDPADSIWSHVAHFKHHMFVAFCMTCSRGLTNKSLEYLNYPTQVIFKSMKLITVMIGSLVILNQRFTIFEYVSAVALVLSAILFSLGDVSTAPEVTGYTGIVIVCLSLVADALHSNTQEQLLKQYKSSILEAMLYTNLFAALMSWVWVIITGEFMPAYEFCAAQPIAYLLFIIRAAVIYLGVLCFVLMISTFGVVKATAITTVRKILTIIISFILFPKPISSRHVLGFIIFTAGICLSVYDQREKSKLPPPKRDIPMTQTQGNRQNGQRSNSVSV